MFQARYPERHLMTTIQVKPKPPAERPEDKIECHICFRVYSVIPHYVRGYCPHCGTASRP